MSTLSNISQSVFKLIPRDELKRFRDETDGAQADCLLWLGWMAEIDNAPRGQKETTIDAIARRTGKGISTIKTKRANYKRLGWSALINRAKFPVKNSSGLPAQFRTWVPTLFLRFQRNGAGRQVHRYLLNRLHKWRGSLADEHAIPGYSSPPADSPDGHPVGWSYKNILTLTPSQTQLVTSRQGKKAASKFLPSNYTTRAGLKYGERFFFDDQIHDIKVNLLGRQSRAMRPLGFNSIEHLSGEFSLFTSKLTLWEPTEKKSRTLTQKDFVWFNVLQLLQVGYRTDSVGTTHIFEHGSGTGDKGFDDRIHHVTDGHVTVWRGGRFNDPMFEGMLFRPQSTGNFRSKSPLESMFNLDRNYMAALPGPVGSNQRLNGPEEHYGLDAYNNQLLKLYEKLPANRREMIQFPYLTFQEFGALQNEVYHLINNREDHHLEGWEKCEHVVNKFRIGKNYPWQPREDLRDLDPERAKAVADLAEWRVFNMSPRAVADRHRHELTKLPLDLVPLLLLPEWRIKVKVKKNHEIHVQDSAVSSEPFIYLAYIKNKHTGGEPIPPGDYEAHWHPLMSQHLWLCDAKGSFIAVLDEFVKPKAGDTPAIISNLNEIRDISSNLNEWTARHLGAVRDDRRKMKDHNSRLAAGEPVTAEERKAATSSKAADTRTRNKPKTRERKTGMTLGDISGS